VPTYGFFKKKLSNGKFQVNDQYSREIRVELDDYILIIERRSIFDIVIFDKEDISDDVETLALDFRSKGHLTHIVPSKLTSQDETNSIFGGSNVPLPVIQNILDAVADTDLPLKNIDTEINLRSNNPYQIQIGGSKASQNTPIITDDTIKKLQAAQSFEEFNALLK
jgi:hypothetical protein